MKLLAPKSLPGSVAFGLLVLRVVAGLGLAHHGWPKIQNPFDWMQGANAQPGILQFLAALSEFGGGIALAAGLLTPLAALGVLATMGFALRFHIGRGDPFVAGSGGPSWELAAMYFAAAAVLLFSGPGGISLDRVLFARGGKSSGDGG